MNHLTIEEVKGGADVQRCNEPRSTNMFGGVVMPRVSFSVPNEISILLRKNAEAKGLSLSKYIAEMVEREMAKSEWPEGYFEQVVGSWQGEVIEGLEDLPLQERDFSKLEDWEV